MNGVKVRVRWHCWESHLSWGETKPHWLLSGWRQSEVQSWALARGLHCHRSNGAGYVCASGLREEVHVRGGHTGSHHQECQTKQLNPRSQHSHELSPDTHRWWSASSDATDLHPKCSLGILCVASVSRSVQSHEWNHISAELFIAVVSCSQSTLTP